MHIFINDCLVNIISDKVAADLAYSEHYDKVVDIKISPLKFEKITGHTLVLNIDEKNIEKLLVFLHKNEKISFHSITLSVKNIEAIIDYVESFYTIIKAAGGVVVKDDKILLIHRLAKWDLPKGKLDKGEKSKIAALREVEEECGVTARLDTKICTTWHTYVQGNKKILKRTKWYKMHLIDDSKMEPQKEEDIDHLEWMTAKKVENAMANSYSSIRFVLEQYFEMEKILF
jgi:8-oxo-(d)GTP phosphatase